MTTAHDNPLITLRPATGSVPRYTGCTGKKARARGESYRERLLPFVDWCEQRTVQYPAQVTLGLLESWQRYLAGLPQGRWSALQP
ncbi:hypothetical protein BDE27_2153 [Xenorhabdus ehlersii]|uniref:Integrase n=1 Tax=Xenorhabdus ehlersii TaxID=290111 RepID=A0ABX9PKD7_9GAMM|nr:hypothetical protein BDE27_2153 [Xenorhabdus ehlersii]